jgi:hypothetical protein
MSEGFLGINRRFLPFSVLSENRTEPFTPDMEKAAIFSLSEIERGRGGGLLLKQPEEKVAFIAKIGYPLWLFQWSQTALVFDGLNQSKFNLTYLAIPDVKTFTENLKRAAKTRETLLAFLVDCVSYFESSIVEKGLVVNGLMQEPEFLTEFECYRREAAKTDQGNSGIGLLTPTINESAISPEIHELENRYLSLQEDVENLTRCMKLLNRVTHQYVKELRDKARTIKIDFEVRIREEEEVVAPRVNQLKDDYDFQISSLAKSFEKRHFPMQQEKARLEKSRDRAIARIEQCKLQAKKHANAGQRAAEQKWKEKANKTRKELSEFEKQLKQAEKALKNLEELRTVEIFNLGEELETKVKEARKSLLELEASRDAKILIHNQEVEKLEKQTRLITDQIGRTIKLQETNVEKFEKIGVNNDMRLEEITLYYAPFYVVCYQTEPKKRYLILPPSNVSSVGVFTKLKGALGMARIKSLLVPQFKTISSFGDAILALTQQNAMFEIELKELGAKNNILRVDSIRAEIKQGLERLKSEGWLSDKEFDAIEQRIG